MHINGLFGARSMTVEHRIDDATVINLELVAYPGYNANHLYEFKDWNGLFPGDVVVKCSYCGQWGARRCECKYCGQAID